MSSHQGAIAASDESSGIGSTFLFSALDQAIVSGTTFFASVLIGRYAGPDELGIYGLAMSIVFFAIGVQDSLISSSYIIHSRLLGEVERRKYAGAVLMQMLCMTTIVSLILASVMIVQQSGWGAARIMWATTVLLLLPPAMLLRQFARKYAYAESRISGAFLLDIISATVQCGAIGAFLLAGMLESITAWVAIVGASCLALSVWWIAFYRYFTFDLSSWAESLQRTFSQGKWLLGCRFVGLTHRHSATWLLGALSAHENIGVFTACMSIVAASNVILYGLANVLEPRLAKAFSSGGAAAVQKIETKLTILLSSAMTLFPLALYFAGGRLVEVVYKGEAYHDQTHAITVLGLALWAESIAMVRSQGLKILHRADLNLRANIIAAVISVGLGAMLIWKFGVVGAAYGILAGNVAASLLRHLAYEQAIREAQ